MTFYIKDRKGQYQAMTVDQVKKLRRVDDVNLLMNRATKAAITLTAMTAWFAHLDRNGRRLSPQDLIAANLPNRTRILAQANDLADAITKIRGT